jgi:hypothetical protein
VAKYKTNWSWWLTPVVLPTQEDHGLKPAQASSSPRPYLEKTLHRKGLVELKPQYCKKKKKKKPELLLPERSSTPSRKKDQKEQ